MSHTNRGLIIFVAVLAILVAGLAYESGWLGGGTTTEAPAQLPLGGPFTLTDQDGVERHDGDFRGKYMLIYFGYTYCPDVCPATLLAITQTMDQLGDDADKVQPIFITIDPERDTPEQMKLYASNFYPKLLALGGTPEQVAEAEKDYRVYAKKVTPQGQGPNDYLMDHSSFIYLMGPDGKLRSLISPDATPDAMAVAIKRQL